MKELHKAFKKTLKKDLKNISYFITSLLATGGIIGVYEITSHDNFLTNSFINIIIYILFLLIYNKQSKTDKNEKIFVLIFSIIISTIMIIGTQLEYVGNILFNFITILKIFSLSFAFYPITNLIIDFINKIKLNNLKNINYKKNFFLTATILFILNFCVFLAIYPGVYGYDAGYQIKEILTDFQLNSHFPLFYCFILASLVNLGKIIFNSYQAGFAIYTFLQMLFLIFVSTKITMYCTKKIKNIYLYLFCLGFFGIFPLYTIMILSAAQDVIFAGVFALIILNILEMVESKDYWKNKIKPITLSILILILCMFRNNGFYCVLIAIPFILLFGKNKKLLTTIIFIIPLCLYKIYTGPIYETMGVINVDSTKEMLSVPSQQLARVYNYNPSKLSNGDIKNLYTYYTTLEDFKYYTFRQSIADPTKGVLNNDVTSNDLTGYIKLWYNVGIKDPKNYIEAFLLNSLGFWYPNKNYKDERMYHPYIEYEMMDGKFYDPEYVDIKRNSKFPLYEKLLNKTVNNNAWKRIPVISTIFTSGTYFVIFIFLIGITILRKNFKYMLPLGLILTLYATLFLSPVALFKYCFPIIILLPIFISLILIQKKSISIK